MALNTSRRLSAAGADAEAQACYVHCEQVLGDSDPQFFFNVYSLGSSTKWCSCCPALQSTLRVPEARVYGACQPITLESSIYKGHKPVRKPLKPGDIIKAVLVVSEPNGSSRYSGQDSQVSTSKKYKNKAAFSGTEHTGLQLTFMSQGMKYVKSTIYPPIKPRRMKQQAVVMDSVVYCWYAPVPSKGVRRYTAYFKV